MPKYIVSQPAITLCIESRSRRLPTTTSAPMSRNACARFVFISHHRTHRFALLQQQFGDRAPYRADAARRAGDQNGIYHVFSSYAFTLNRKCSILFEKRGVSYRLHQRPDGSLLNHSRQTHSGLTARGESWATTRLLGRSESRRLRLICG